MEAFGSDNQDDYHLHQDKAQDSYIQRVNACEWNHGGASAGFRCLLWHTWTTADEWQVDGGLGLWRLGVASWYVSFGYQRGRHKDYEHQRCRDGNKWVAGVHQLCAVLVRR